MRLWPNLPCSVSGHFAPVPFLPLFLVSGPLSPLTPSQDPGVSLNTTFFSCNSASQVPLLGPLLPVPTLPRLGEASLPPQMSPTGSCCHLLVIRRTLIVETLILDNINNILQIDKAISRKKICHPRREQDPITGRVQAVY